MSQSKPADEISQPESKKYERNLKQKADDTIQSAIFELLRLCQPSTKRMRDALEGLLDPENIISESMGADILESFRDLTECQFLRVKSIIHACISEQYELIKKYTSNSGGVVKMPSSDYLSEQIKPLLQLLLQSLPATQSQDETDSHTNVQALDLIAHIRHASSHNTIERTDTDTSIDFINNGIPAKKKKKKPVTYKLSVDLVYQLCRYLPFLVYNAITYDTLMTETNNIHLVGECKWNSDGLILISSVYSFMNCLDRNIDIYEYSQIDWVVLDLITRLKHEDEFWNMDTWQMVNQLCAFIPYWVYNVSHNADVSKTAALNAEIRSRGLKKIWHCCVKYVLGGDRFKMSIIRDATSAFRDIFVEHCHATTAAEMNRLLYAVLKTIQVVVQWKPMIASGNFYDWIQLMGIHSLDYSVSVLFEEIPGWRDEGDDNQRVIEAFGVDNWRRQVELFGADIWLVVIEMFGADNWVRVFKLLGVENWNQFWERHTIDEWLRLIRSIGFDTWLDRVELFCAKYVHLDAT